jgi:hypothetical protein
MVPVILTFHLHYGRASYALGFQCLNHTSACLPPKASGGPQRTLENPPNPPPTNKCTGVHFIGHSFRGPGGGVHLFRTHFPFPFYVGHLVGHSFQALRGVHLFALIWALCTSRARCTYLGGGFTHFEKPTPTRFGRPQSPTFFWHLCVLWRHLFRGFALLTFLSFLGPSASS